jgi:DNA-binding transcriptional ArsR family regulator
LAGGAGRAGQAPGGPGLTAFPKDAAGGAFFAALADSTRRLIIEWLSGEGPATATELARRLPITRQAVAKHLAALERAGLVAGRKEGRDVRFRLRAEPLTEAMQWMAALAARWDERLDALADYLDRDQTRR